MVKRKKEFSSDELKKAIIEGAQEKKALGVTALDLRELPNASSDFYVICHGQTDRQTEAIAKSIEETVFNKLGIWPYHSEGYTNKEWILLDYFEIVAHIFVANKREFFAIEELWADARAEEFETIY